MVGSTARAKTASAASENRPVASRRTKTMANMSVTPSTSSGLAIRK